MEIYNFQTKQKHDLYLDWLNSYLEDSFDPKFLINWEYFFPELYFSFVIKMKFLGQNLSTETKKQSF